MAAGSCSWGSPSEVSIWRRTGMTSRLSQRRSACARSSRETSGGGLAASRGALVSCGAGLAASRGAPMESGLGPVALAVGPVE